MKQLHKKTPLVFRIAAILLCLVVASSCMMGGLFARYATTVSGSDSARAAKFSVSAVMVEGSLDSRELDLRYADAEQSVSWSFTVESNSEVTSVDTVSVVLPSACPAGLELTMTVNGESIGLTTSDKITYTCAADLDFQDTHNWVLTFTGDPDAAEEATLENIAINVKVEQKD